MPTHRPLRQTAAPLLSLIGLASIGLVAPPSASAAPATSAPSASFSLPGLLGKNLADYEAVLGQPKYVQPAPADSSAARWTETRYYKPAVPGVQRVVLSRWVAKGADGTPAPETLVVRAECQFAPNGSVKTWQAALRVLGFSPTKANVTKSDAGKTTLALTDTPSVEHIEWNPATTGPNAASSLVFTVAAPTPDATASTNATLGGTETEIPVGPTPNFPPIDFNNLPYQQTVQQMAEQWRVKYGLPGVWCAVIKGGKVVACVADGVKNVQTKAPAQVSDRLAVGSVSKVITGSLVASFVADGTIKYETTVGEVFPELAKQYPNNPLPGATLRELLSHTSGLPAGHPSVQSDNGRDARLNTLKASFKLNDLKAPGSQYLYSYGLQIAVAMIERRTGTIYDSWLEGPRGRSLGFINLSMIDPRHIGANEIVPHYLDNGISVVGEVSGNPNLRFAPDGGCYLTLTDACSFINSFDTNGTALPEDIYKALCTRAIPELGSDTSGSWHIASHGYLFHEGDTVRGEIAAVRADPRNGDGFIVYTNANFRDRRKADDVNIIHHMEMDLYPLLSL